MTVLTLGGGFFSGNTELSLELWTVISGISGFDNYAGLSYSPPIIFKFWRTLWNSIFHAIIPRTIVRSTEVSRP